MTTAFVLSKLQNYIGREDEHGAEIVYFSPVHDDDLYYESEPNAISKDLYQMLCQKLLIQGYVDMSQYKCQLPPPIEAGA